VRRRDFETMGRGMTRELPPGFLDGIIGITVTGKTVPHPVREGIYTLGECVPHDFTDQESGAQIRSAVFLHYGSFAALARIDDRFDWRHEAWETLTHEVRHHLEWRARAPDLERLDDAAEANYARRDGEPFPPQFHLDGERLEAGVTRVDDDVFLDAPVTGREHARLAGAAWPFTWHGRRWTVPLPARLPDALFLVVTGLTPAPAGDVVIVLRRKPGARDVLRRATVVSAEARAAPA
jgi:hypothetical protein